MQVQQNIKFTEGTLESRFVRNSFTRFRLYAVGDEQINRELEELIRPYQGM
jgi:hypothetical protein